MNRAATFCLALVCVFAPMSEAVRAADAPSQENNGTSPILRPGSSVFPNMMDPASSTRGGLSQGERGPVSSGQGDMRAPADGRPFGAATGSGTGDTVELPAIRYYVVNQTLQQVLTELAYLAKLNINIDGSFETRVQNHLARGAFAEALDDLGRLHGFVWHLDGGMLEVTPIRSVLSRTIKLDNMEEERIRELIAASGLRLLRDSVSYDATTGVLRLRGSPRFVAKAEAAILIAIKSVGEETINVIRFGRNSRTSQPAARP